LTVIRRERALEIARDYRGSDYHFFRKPLRRDFRHTCGYCGVWERQGGGAGDFCIDHFVPMSRGGLVYDPFNLIYACNQCNSRKRDTPPMDPEGKGRNLLDPCVVDFADHFIEAPGDTISGLSLAAEFMIEKLRLNGARAIQKRRHRRLIRAAILQVHQLRKRWCRVHSLRKYSGARRKNLEKGLEGKISTLRELISTGLPRTLD